jgi:hypothetical protein
MPVFELPAQTPEEHALRTVAQCKSRVNATVQLYAAHFRREYDAFWRNPHCTPQHMASAWGTDAVQLFAKSALTRDYLLTLDAGCLSEDYTGTPEPVTAHADGTVTIG